MKIGSKYYRLKVYKLPKGGLSFQFSIWKTTNRPSEFYKHGYITVPYYYKEINI